jgi:hypothetical protein
MVLEQMQARLVINLRQYRRSQSSTVKRLQMPGQPQLLLTTQNLPLMSLDSD